MSHLRLKQTQSLAQRVTARLRQSITEGEFPPGSNIPEERLAQSFGVSRTPVREALNQLQLEGLVVIRPQVGSFVFTPDIDDVVMLCQYRLGLEPWAAELAYHSDKAATNRDLAVALGEMDTALEGKESFRFARADTAFHEAFISHCGNRYVQESYRLVGGRVATLRTNYSAPIDIQTSISIDGHRALARMFDAGDFVEFKRLTGVHMGEYEQTLRAQFGRSEPAARLQAALPDSVSANVGIGATHAVGCFGDRLR